MKRILLYAAGFILLTLSYSSCQNDCKVCQQNTYINNVLDQQGTPTEYCGSELTAVESTPDYTLGNKVTKWECR